MTLGEEKWQPSWEVTCTENGGWDWILCSLFPCLRTLVVNFFAIPTMVVVLFDRHEHCNTQCTSNKHPNKLHMWPEPKVQEKLSTINKNHVWLEGTRNEIARNHMFEWEMHTNYKFNNRNISDRNVQGKTKISIKSFNRRMFIRVIHKVTLSSPSLWASFHPHRLFRRYPQSKDIFIKSQYEMLKLSI